MIGVLHSQSAATKYVFSAFERSFSTSQVASIDCLMGLEDSASKLGAIVMISPTAEELSFVKDAKNIKKIVIFGELPVDPMNGIEVAEGSWPTTPWGKADSADINSFSESKEKVVYLDNTRRLLNHIEDRPLERFDFMDEWNNLGFGAITTDASIWSLKVPLIIGDQHALAHVYSPEDVICSYSALIEMDGKSLLWFNREVGPVDSYEWQIVELYLSSYAENSSACYPVLLEVPSGFDCVTTMRLDCDEDIESSRYLWQAYRMENVPFSLAIHTTNLQDRKHFSLIKEVNHAGGAILSHTATHAPNWGGSYESAIEEAKVSAKLIEEIINKPVHYAVAPFHHTPIYALKALSDTGYLGCIGGIIKNDPEFLTFNGGNIPDLPRSFVVHSQQVMLHGDCLLNNENDHLRIYKESFNLSKNSNTIFGFLDHPFSDRYQYGWLDEEQRKNAHVELINYIRDNSNSPCFLNEIQVMEFLQDKSNCEVSMSNDKPHITHRKGYLRLSALLPKVLYKGTIHETHAHEI